VNLSAPSWAIWIELQVAESLVVEVGDGTPDGTVNFTVLWEFDPPITVTLPGSAQTSLKRLKNPLMLRVLPVLVTGAVIVSLVNRNE